MGQNLPIHVLPSAHGMGAYASRAISKGETLFIFSGPIVHRRELPVPYDSVADHYLQVGADEYIGPSEGPEDYVNHSCDPNTGCHFSTANSLRPALVAIRDIKEGEEITFDYSTTMAEDEWELDCGCRSENCRGRIRDFSKLIRPLQEHYIALDVVPSYILASLNHKGSEERRKQ